MIKILSVWTGLICGIILLRMSGETVLHHGIRVGTILGLSNWIMVSGAFALIAGAIDVQVQFYGWVAVGVSASVRLLADRRRVRGSQQDRRLPSA